MKNPLLNQSGNAILAAVVVGSLGLAGLTLVMKQGSDFSKQVGKSESSSSASEEAEYVLKLIQKKFEFPKRENPKADTQQGDGEDLYIYKKPDWLATFPSRDHAEARPTIDISTQPATKSFIPLKLVLGISESGSCKRLEQPVFKEQTDETDCDVLSLVADEQGVAGIQKLEDLTKTDDFQYSAIGINSISNLSNDEKKQFFQPEFIFPLDKLKSTPVKFLSYQFTTEHNSNPQIPSGLIVQVNKIKGIVPLQPPPPPSACEVSLKNPEQEPVDLRKGDVTVLFDVKANSLVQQANFNLGNDDGELLGSFSSNQMDPQSLKTFGTLTSLKADGFPLTLSNSEADIASDKPDEFLKRIAVTLTGLSSVPTDVTADGSPVERQSTTCYAIIRIRKIMPPLCSLGIPNMSSVLKKGDQAKVVLNCENIRGGPVSSATIDNQPVTISFQKSTGIKILTDQPKYNACLLSADSATCSATTSNLCTQAKLKQGYQTFSCYKTKEEFETVESSDLEQSKSKIYTGTYIRKTDGEKETIVAQAIGPGGTWDGSIVLGEVCPYADPKFSRTEYTLGSVFQDKIGKDTDARTIASADLIYTRGSLTYTSGGAVWVSGPSGNFITHIALSNENFHNGNWDKPEVCLSNSFCMIVSKPKVQFWVEVAPKDSKQCTVIKTKARRFGCFAGSTKLKMADGTDKLVSQIGENEWVYNPHFQTPVRIKSVVKGPEKKPLFEVSYADKKVVVTEDHPFLTRSGWVQAINLRPGALLVGAGTGKTVKSVKKLPFNQAEDVWNFELDTEEPMGHIVLANGIPAGDLVTQKVLKKTGLNLP